jgi:nicotinamide-nucleotide amidase
MTPEPSATAELIAVGDEVLAGHTVNSNASHLAIALATVGVEVRWHAAVGDREDDIVDALRRACSRASVVLVCGGLGPTPDDLTRHAAARLLDVPLDESPEALEHMRRIFESMCRSMAESNRRQALFPRGATLMPNDNGTAWGFNIACEGTPCYFLPGVPKELYAMTPGVLRDIAARVEGAALRHVAQLRTVGIGESDMVVRLSELLTRGGDPEVGTYASEGILTIRAIGQRKDEVERLADAIAERLGDLVYTRDDRSLEEVLVRTMSGSGRTLALAESCTGGLVGEMITRVSGSSAVLVEGAVVYSNEAKTRTCGVPAELIERHGAVSEPVSRALAEGMRERTGADYAISITGIAGPTGGTETKPVGLVYIGLADKGGTEVRECRFGANRERNRQRSARTALDMLRRRL